MRSFIKTWKSLFTLLVAAAFVLEASRGMTALAADRPASAIKETGLVAYPVAANVTIYKGGMVCINASGYAVPAADTSGFSNVVGVAHEKVAGGSSNGTYNVRVRSNVVVLLGASSITQAMVGTAMYVVDDQTVDETSPANGIRAGILQRYVSATSGWVLIREPQTALGTVGASDLGTDSVTAVKLKGALRTGYIPLNLFAAQIISTNAIPDTGNFLDGNTDPEIIRVNGATDKQAMISWPANSVVEIQLPAFAYPPDLDDAAAIEVHLLTNMAAGGMDTPVIAVGYFEGIGDTNAGGNTAALSVTLSDVSVAIAAGDVGAAPKVATITLIPGTHANEAVQLFAAWIEYTRKDN